MPARASDPDRCLSGRRRISALTPRQFQWPGGANYGLIGSSPVPVNRSCRVFAVDGGTAHDKNVDYQAHGGNT